MSTEWNAWDTVSRLVRRSVTSASIASAGPETTTAEGPLTAAMSSSSPISSRTVASSASIASIAPPAGNACISRPRATTSFTASSRSKTPATWAAAISPTEWPSR
ncbi:hypothetical protein GCM10010435_23970 [Winogradskya consettensis]